MTTHANDHDWPAVLDEVTATLDTLGDVLNREDDFGVLLHQYSCWSCT